MLDVPTFGVDVPVFGNVHDGPIAPVIGPREPIGAWDF